VTDARHPDELLIVMPADRAFADMIRDVVAHGARNAGAPDAAALNFALTVEDAVRELVGEVVSDERLGVLLRLQEHPLQVTITLGRDSRTLILDV
jgi:hypothetical protein